MNMHRPRPERQFEIGFRVRSAMAEAGVVQEQLAAALEISQSSLCSKLAGRTGWYVFELADVAAALEVPVGDLVPPSTMEPLLSMHPRRGWLVDPTVGQRMPLVGNKEIASTVDVSKGVISNWINRESMQFPRPVAVMAQGPVFWWPQVYQWLTEASRASVLKGMKGRARPADEQLPWRPVPNPMPKLVGVADIAGERGVATATVINWRRRGTVVFPEPLARLSMGEVYLAAEVDAALDGAGTSETGSPVQTIDV